jgi:hypothetical protein
MYAAKKAMMGGGAAFTPFDLFPGSEIGFWLDYSDKSTMFTDTSGTTPVTADGDAIARINDKLGQGFNATQATAGNRPTFKDVSGVRFSDHASDWLTILSSTASLSFLHKDAGTGIAVLVRVGTTSNENALYGFLGNTQGATANVGAHLFFDDRVTVPRNDRAGYGVVRGVDGTSTYDLQSSDGDFSTPVDHSLFVTTPAGGPAEMFIDNISVGTDVKDLQRSLSNATHDLQIGTLGNNAFPLVGRMYQVITRDKSFTTQELDDIQTFFAGKL